MRRLNWNHFFPLLAPALVILMAASQAPAVTLSELRSITADNQSLVTTAHLVYVEEFDDNRPVSESPAIFKYEKKITTIHKHTRTKADAIIDRHNKTVKKALTDLRDLDELLQQNDLPANQNRNISNTKTLVIQGTYEMELSTIEEPPMLGLFERPDPPDYMFELLSLGAIDRQLLSEDNKPVLTEIHSSGKTSLLVNLTVEKARGLQEVKIECDPSMGYRFRRIEWRSNGQLAKETIADDYRNVNGIPYPFRYINRRLDKDGKVRTERKYVIESAELGVSLSANDFKISVPAGTVVTDTVISMTSRKIDQQCHMSIDDVLALGTSWLEK